MDKNSNSETIESFNRCMVGFWHQYESEFYRFFLGRLHNKALAQDYTQDLFLKSRVVSDHFCSMDNPRAWLYQAARNMVVDHWRSLKNVEDLPEDLSLAIDAFAPVDTLVTCLPKTLLHLSEQDRYIVQACDIDNMKQTYVAKQMGLSLSTLKSRLLRARKKLKQALLAECKIEFDDARICCHKHDQ